jgi:hypothetical protein
MSWSMDRGGDAKPANRNEWLLMRQINVAQHGAEQAIEFDCEPKRGQSHRQPDCTKSRSREPAEGDVLVDRITSQRQTARNATTRNMRIYEAKTPNVHARLPTYSAAIKPDAINLGSNW